MKYMDHKQAALLLITFLVFIINPFGVSWLPRCQGAAHEPQFPRFMSIPNHCLPSFPCHFSIIDDVIKGIKFPCKDLISLKCPLWFHRDHDDIFKMFVLSKTFIQDKEQQPILVFEQQESTEIFTYSVLPTTTTKHEHMLCISHIYFQH